MIAHREIANTPDGITSVSRDAGRSATAMKYAENTLQIVPEDRLSEVG